MKTSSMHYYTVYKRKNDELVASGTAAECAEQMQVSLHTFYSIVTRVKNGTNKKYEIDIQIK